MPENELDGLGCWMPSEKAGEFARVVIRPADRGKGLSVLLVSNVLRVMRKRGIGTVHISVAKENIPAQKTYLTSASATSGRRRCGDAASFCMN